jgi:tRNA modification GTPase
MNRLTGLDRSICGPIGGTTRDLLSAPLNLGESECLLVDIPGLGETSDELDARAQAAGREAICAADLILRVFDATSPDAGDHREFAQSIRAATHIRAATVRERSAPAEEGRPTDERMPMTGAEYRLSVANKCDLLDESTQKKLPADCHVSAVTGDGCDDLIARIAAALSDRDVVADESAVALMAEHRGALADSVEAVERAMGLAEVSEATLDDADLVAVELHAAADALAVLVGRDQTEDMLGRIFARFCVGK